MGILKSLEEARCIPEIVSGHPGRLRTVLPLDFKLDNGTPVAVLEYLLDLPFFLAVNGDRLGDGLSRSSVETFRRFFEWTEFGDVLCGVYPCREPRQLVRVGINTLSDLVGSVEGAMKFGRAALSREHACTYPNFIADLIRAPRALAVLAPFHGLGRRENVLSHSFQDLRDLTLGHACRRVPRAGQRLGHSWLPEEVGLERGRPRRPLDITIDSERGEGQCLLPPAAVSRDRRDQPSLDYGVSALDLPARLC